MRLHVQNILAKKLSQSDQYEANYRRKNAIIAAFLTYWSRPAQSEFTSPIYEGGSTKSNPPRVYGNIYKAIFWA